MFSSSESFNDSFTGSGFSYDDEYYDDVSDSEDVSDYTDGSLNDFEDDDMYDDSFDDDLEEDDADSSSGGSRLDNGFNDDFEEM